MRRTFCTIVALSVALAIGPARAQTTSTVPPTTLGSQAVPVPTSLTSLQSWNSQCVLFNTGRAYTWYGATAAAATISAQRFLDQQCTQPAENPTTALPLAQGGNCPGSTFCGRIKINDGTPALAVKVNVTDTSGATNAVTSLILLNGAGQ